MFSTPNAFHSQDWSVGVRLSDMTDFKRDINIRIITPTDDKINEITSELKQNQQTKNIEIRHIQEALSITITVLIVDRKHSLSIELIDDTEANVHETIRFATYSNSKSSAISYIAIFESLWKQVELIEQISKMTEKLKTKEKVHKEFINIAAHELRSPVQPILGLAELLRSRKEIGIGKQDELLTVIIRNAKRLKELTENILDITRIEDQTLHLHKELVDLDDSIANTLEPVVKES